MYISEFYLSMIIGVTVALLLVEFTGLNPGGMILPGYLAIRVTDPFFLMLVLFIALTAFGITKFILPKFLVIYGRRKFVAVILISLVLKLLFELAFPLLPFTIFEIAGLGIIVPALLANSFFKQGIKLTLGITSIAIFSTFLLLQGSFLLF